MKCKKCKKEIADGSIFCNWCGVAQIKALKKSMYQRPDGLYEKNLTIDGKRKVFRGKTEREVLQKIAAYEGERKSGTPFNKLAEEWKEVTWKRITRNSIYAYSSAFDDAIDNFGNTPSVDITVDAVQSYLKQFIQKNYAQKTIKNKMLVLRLILNLAVDKGEIEVNPVTKVKLPQNLPKKKRTAPSKEEIATVHKNVDKDFGLFPFFIYHTGCRLGEALAITGKDIDRANKKLSINKSLYWDGNKPAIGSTKTEAGVRIVPIPDILLEVVPNIKQNEYLFSDNGKLLSKSKYRSLYSAYQKETGITSTAHCFRHGYATMLYEAGVDVKDAQYLLGHATISMTMDTYTHITTEQKEKTAKAINKHLNATKKHSNTKKPHK